MLSGVRYDGKIIGLEKGKGTGYPLGDGKRSEQLHIQTIGLEENDLNPKLDFRDSPI